MDTATGVKEINEWLADNGVFMDPNFHIEGIQAMTPDGTQIFGSGKMLTPPYATKSFRIRVPATLDAPAPVAVTRLELSAPHRTRRAAHRTGGWRWQSESDVDLAVFDAAGRHVTTLLSGPASRRDAGR